MSLEVRYMRACVLAQQPRDYQAWDMSTLRDVYFVIAAPAVSFASFAQSVKAVEGPPPDEMEEVNEQAIETMMENKDAINKSGMVSVDVNPPQAEPKPE